jgi:hypothetical protein
VAYWCAPSNTSAVSAPPRRAAASRTETGTAGLAGKLGLLGGGAVSKNKNKKCTIF